MMFLGRIILILWLSVAEARIIKLGYLFIQAGPGPDNGWGASWVQESFSQFKLGVLDVNNDSSILPNDTITFDLVDTKGDQYVAFDGAGTLLDAGVVGLVGTGYSSALSAPGVFCSSQKKPIVSPGSTALSLSVKSSFPYVVRSIASDAGVLKAMVATIFELGWKKSAVLINKDFQEGSRELLGDGMEACGIAYLMLVYGAPEDDNGQAIIANRDRLSDQMTVIADAGFRIIFAYMKTVDVQGVNATASAAGIGFRSPAHTWMTTAAADPLVQYEPQMFTLKALTPTGARAAWYKERWPRVTTLWDASVHGGYNSSTGLPFFGPNAANDATVWDTDYAQIGDGKPDVWGTFVYDTVWLYAHALHALSLAGKDINDGEALLHQLLQTSFEGVTGELRFDQFSQDRIQPLSIYLSSPSQGFEEVGHATAALASWDLQGPCLGGCTTLNRTRLGLKWPDGKLPTDGRALDAQRSSTIISNKEYMEGSSIEVVVLARDSFGHAPCQRPCSSNATECSSCLAEVVDYHKVLPTFQSIAGENLFPVQPLAYNVEASSGTVRIQVPAGISGSGPEDRSVTMRVMYGNNVLQSSEQVLTLKSTSCPAGSYGTDSTCLLCGPGLFSPVRGAQACTSCKSGEYQDVEGLSSCKACQQGMYSNVGAATCVRCAIGKYQDMTGQGNCTTCAGALTTQFLGAENSSACQCPTESYRDPQNRDQCHTCLEGMTCAFGSDATVGASVYPMLKPRHWSSVTKPLDVFSCDDFRCPGGEPGACGPDMVDDSCARCRKGFAFDGEKCYECANVEQTNLLYPTLPLLLVPVFVCFLYKNFGDTYENWGNWRNGLAGLAFIVLNHYQIIAMLKNVNVELPNGIAVNFEFWSFSSDFGTLFKPQCAGFNINENLIVKTIFPGYYLGLGLVTVLISRVVAKCAKGVYMESNRAFNAVVSMMLTFFLAMVGVALTLFICKSNPNNTSSLAVDRSITCFEESWSSLLAIGIVAVLFWVVGVAAVFVWAIFTMPARMHDPTIRMRWKFLFIKFRPDRYWWALTFLARGVLLNLGLVILSSGFAQIFWMMSVLSIYQLLAIWCMPWRHMLSNLVDIAAMICLSLSGSCLLWFAKDGVSEAERRALDKDLIGFSIAFSLLLMPFPLYAGAHIVWSNVSGAAKARKESDIAAIGKALTGLAAADGAVLNSFVTNLGEWDYFFTRQCSSVIYFEYFGLQHLSPGYTTIQLDDAEKTRRISAGEKDAGSNKGDDLQASQQEDDDLSKAKFTHIADPAPAIEVPQKQISEVSDPMSDVHQLLVHTPRAQEVTVPRTPREETPQVPRTPPRAHVTDPGSGSLDPGSRMLR